MALSLSQFSVAGIKITPLERWFFVENFLVSFVTRSG